MQYPLSFASQLREHLRALRKQRSLTQAELGQLVGLSQARIAEIEHNPGVVSMEQWMKLLSALRASLVLQNDIVPSATVKPTAPPASTKPVAKKQARLSKATLPAPPAPPAPSAPLKSYVIRPKKGSW